MDSNEIAPARVDYQVAGGVATITLDRPEVRNAVDLPTAERIAAALDRLDADPAVTVGVFAGAGPTFCAGMDLKAFSATRQRPVTASRGAFGIAARPPEKPLIAAVEGIAFGGGFEIALACDLIVAATDAKFALPEAKRGLVAAAGGVLRLPNRIPRNVAMELVLTGAPITATRGAELGLVNRVVAPGTVVAQAQSLAAEIAANAPFAVRTAKHLVDAAADWPAAEAFERQQPAVEAVRSSADAAEGARAFLEKRRPRWTGR